MQSIDERHRDRVRAWKEAARLYAKGLTYAQVGRRMGRSAAWVHWAVERAQDATPPFGYVRARQAKNGNGPHAA